MGAPFWLRLGVGGLSQVSPGRAASLAHRFFCRPKLTNGYSKGDLPILAKAEALLSEGFRKQTTVLGRRIISYHFTAEPVSHGLVLLLHGWSGDSRAMTAFIRALTLDGYDAVVLDLPAHGASDGVETNVVDAAVLVGAFLAANDLQPDHVIAHSYGGAVASLLALAGEAPLSFTSISAPTKFALALSEISTAFNLSEEAERLFSIRAAQSLQCDLTALDALEVWKNAKTSVLVIHSPDDLRVSFEHALHLDQAPNVRLIRAEGADHCEIVYCPFTVAAAVNHIVQTNRALRSIDEGKPEVA